MLHDQFLLTSVVLAIATRGRIGSGNHLYYLFPRNMLHGQLILTIIVLAIAVRGWVGDGHPLYNLFPENMLQSELLPTRYDIISCHCQERVGW